MRVDRVSGEGVWRVCIERVSGVVTSVIVTVDEPPEVS